MALLDRNGVLLRMAQLGVVSSCELLAFLEANTLIDDPFLGPTAIAENITLSHY